MDSGVIELVDETLCGAVVALMIIHNQSGNGRMCEDFIVLNNYTVSDIYIITCVDIVIHRILVHPESPSWI